MNRRFAPIALLALGALLTACQDKPADSTTPTAAPTAATPASTSSAGTATAPAASAAQSPYEIASQGHGFTVGPMMAAHTVYVFFDPACPHCARLWQAAQPVASRLKIVWMPVQLLRPLSAQQGAAILTAADPAAAMALNEASVLARGPGIEVPPSLPDDAVAKVKANTELFNKLNADSVPFIVTKTGTHAGAVTTEQLAAMAGL